MNKNLLKVIPQYKLKMQYVSKFKQLAKRTKRAGVIGSACFLQYGFI